ncbi:MAG: methyl-accepting chemotaxis protein [Parahaliea sp.]
MTSLYRKAVFSTGAGLPSLASLACLVGALCVFVMAPQADAQEADTAVAAGKLRVLSQRVVSNARDTELGRQQAFSQLAEDIDRFNAILDQGVFAGDTSTITAAWRPVEGAARSLIGAGQNVVMVNNITRDLQDSVSEIQGALSGIVTVLEQTGGDGKTIAAAQKTLWLTERVTRNMEKLQLADERASSTAEEIKVDVVEFERTVDALRHGNKIMGISAVDDPNALGALERASTAFEIVSEPVSKIVAAAPSLAGVSTARETVVERGPQLANVISDIMISAGGQSVGSAREGVGTLAIVLAGITVIALVLLAWALLKLRARGGFSGEGVDDINNTLMKIADGDLTVQALEENQLLEVARELNVATAHQRELIRNIRTPFDIADDEVNRIGNTTMGQHKKSRDLTRAIVDSSTATADMVRISDQIKKATEKAAQTSKRNRMQVSRGYELTKDMSKASSNVRESVQETSKSAKRQGELIQSVTTAAEYIQALNTKISVVAINTRIEAEKAGEHGRPFLGIAEAIGDLLWEAEEEGRKIISEVRMLQNLSAENLSSIETTVSTVVTILEYIDRLDASLEEINEGSNEISTIIHSVDDAAAHSSDSAQHVNGLMNAIRDRNKEISDFCDKTQMHIGALQQSMRAAAENLGRFRIGESGRAGIAKPSGMAGAKPQAVYGENEMQAMELGENQGKASV